MMILKYPCLTLADYDNDDDDQRLAKSHAGIFLRKTIFAHPFIMSYRWAFLIGKLALGSWNDSFMNCWPGNDMVGFLLLFCFIFFKICRNKICPKIVSLHSVCKNWCNQISITNLFDEVLRKAESWYTYLNEITTWSKHSVQNSLEYARMWRSCNINSWSW